MMLSVDRLELLHNEFPMKENDEFSWVTFEASKKFALSWLAPLFLFPMSFWHRNIGRKFEEIDKQISISDAFVMTELAETKSDVRRCIGNNALSVSFRNGTEVFLRKLKNDEKLLNVSWIDGLVIGNGKIKWAIIL